MGTPGVHGIKIDRPRTVAKAQGGSGVAKTERKIDKNAHEGRPKSVVPVDVDAMAQWMPIANRNSRPDMEGHRWGNIDIEYPARPVVLAQKERGHKAHKATDYGTAPSRMHRLPVDSKVFKSKRHTRQGTVLIDCSGSMDLSAEEIRELIEWAPAAVIAAYAGRGDRGVIRILAADGKMVNDADLELHYGNNIVDGPAIAWLAQQRGPRVMVTDGMMVTASPNVQGCILRIEGSKEQELAMQTYGWSDKSPIAAQANRIAAKARVTIVESPLDAKKHLR